MVALDTALMYSSTCHLSLSPATVCEVWTQYQVRKMALIDHLVSADNFCGNWNLSIHLPILVSVWVSEHYLPQRYKYYTHIILRAWPIKTGTLSIVFIKVVHPWHSTHHIDSVTRRCLHALTLSNFLSYWYAYRRNEMLLARGDQSNCSCRRRR